jgi:hypothetical protein
MSAAVGDAAETAKKRTTTALTAGVHLTAAVPGTGVGRQPIANSGHPPDFLSITSFGESEENWRCHCICNAKPFRGSEGHLFSGVKSSGQARSRPSERPGELERHLRVVFVDDRRSGVLADVETLIEREFASGQVCSMRPSPTSLPSTVSVP